MLFFFKSVYGLFSTALLISSVDLDIGAFELEKVILYILVPHGQYSYLLEVLVPLFDKALPFWLVNLFYTIIHARLETMEL